MSTATGAGSRTGGAAAELLRREAQRVPGPALGATWPELDVATAYAVQDEGLRRRIARGERRVGVKVGLTSVAARERLGADEPVVAWLTDVMALPAGRAVPRLIDPRAEPEIAFVMGERLAGPGVTAARALASVAAVCAGVEIVDSRYADPAARVADVVADNGAAAAFVTGPVAVPPSGVDLSVEACLFEVDGSVVDSATGAAVLGHPAEALAFAANALAGRGHAIAEGWIVLTGAMTRSVRIASSTVAAHFTTLGTVVLPGGSTDAAG